MSVVIMVSRRVFVHMQSLFHFRNSPCHGQA
jgi:hypothetical protein